MPQQALPIPKTKKNTVVPRKINTSRKEHSAVKRKREQEKDTFVAPAAPLPPPPVPKRAPKTATKRATKQTTKQPTTLKKKAVSSKRGRPKKRKAPAASPPESDPPSAAIVAPPRKKKKRKKKNATPPPPVRMVHKWQRVKVLKMLSEAILSHVVIPMESSDPTDALSSITNTNNDNNDDNDDNDNHVLAHMTPGQITQYAQEVEQHLYDLIIAPTHLSTELNGYRGLTYRTRAQTLTRHLRRNAHILLPRYSPQLLACLPYRAIIQGTELGDRVQAEEDEEKRKRQLLIEAKRQALADAHEGTSGRRCYKCKAKCTPFHLQTRSADEGMTVFWTCQDCGKVSKG